MLVTLDVGGASRYEEIEKPLAAARKLIRTEPRRVAGFGHYSGVVAGVRSSR